MKVLWTKWYMIETTVLFSLWNLCNGEKQRRAKPPLPVHIVSHQQKSSLWFSFAAALLRHKADSFMTTVTNKKQQRRKFWRILGVQLELIFTDKQVYYVRYKGWSLCLNNYTSFYFRQLNILLSCLLDT